VQIYDLHCALFVAMTGLCLMLVHRWLTRGTNVTCSAFHASDPPTSSSSRLTRRKLSSLYFSNM